MTGKDMFIQLQDIGEDLIEEAEIGQFPAAFGEGRKTRRMRPLLIAALIAVLLLLVGCAVVYSLRMRDLKIGENQVTVPAFDENGEWNGDFESVPQQILTLSGVVGTAEYQAAQEWFRFLQEYDPDYEVLNVLNAINLVSFGDPFQAPARYDAYRLYTQEMVDKIDEIAEKYGLTLLGAGTKVSQGKKAYEELGIDSLLVPGSNAVASIQSATKYASGSVYIDYFPMDMPKEPGQWPHSMTNRLYYCKKGSFHAAFMWLEDPQQWREWEYTTASGQKVLILRSEYEGWVICDREDAMISLRVESSYSVYTGDRCERDSMTDRQLEQVADAIDFSITPAAAEKKTASTPTAIAPKAGYNVELKSAVTDGYMAYITLGITAPEGTSLADFYLRPGNLQADLLTSGTPAADTVSVAACQTQESPDGRENRREMVIRVYREREGGEKPFGADTTWVLRIRNLIGSYRNPQENDPPKLVLTEEVWEFPISFEGSNLREKAILKAPMDVCYGRATDLDGKDVELTANMTSFTLRSMSAVLLGDNVTVWNFRDNIHVVMKDGTWVRLVAWGEAPGGINLVPRIPIDLDEADHISLPDGSQLSIPKSDQ